MKRRHTNHPQEVVDTVADARADGLPYSLISRATGLTRNQIAGILFRNGLTVPGAGPFGEYAADLRRAAAERKRTEAQHQAAFKRTRSLPPPKQPRLEPEPLWEPVAVPDMPKPLRGCLFIPGEKGRDFARYVDAPRCGERRQLGSSYCPAHHRACYRTIQELIRERNAEATMAEVA